MIRRRLLAAAAGSVGLTATWSGWNLAENPTFVAEHQQRATQHWVQTDDGAHIWMERYEGDGPAVILCHGISSNHHFWDLAPDRSLALYLNDQGYDVWNLDLRGHGPARNHPDGTRQQAGWNVDDYGTHDLPAAFAYVLDQSNESEVHYVGHSMGGMVLAIYLSQNSLPPLASAVAVGSPLDFRDPDLVTDLALKNTWAVSALSFVPSPMGAKLIKGFEQTPLGIDDRLFNPGLMSPGAREQMYDRIVSPLSHGEMMQFGRAARNGEFASADGSTTYRTSLDDVTTPMLFLAGRADRIAAADRVWSYYDAIGSDDKRFVMLSEANGFKGDYGHLDFGVSDFAADEVFPLIGGWIEDHR